MGLQTTNPMCLVQPTRNHTKQQCAGHRCVCSFFTVFLHSPKPFARCKKQGHYMLIKMSEVLKKKKYRPGNDIFIWKRFSRTKIEASIVKCWVMQNGWGLHFTPAGGTFYKRRMSEKQGRAPRARRRSWNSLPAALSTPPPGFLGWQGPWQPGHKKAGGSQGLQKDQLSPLGSRLFDPLWPSFRSISALQSYQESPKIEIRGD